MLSAYVLEELDGEEIVGAFYGKKKLQKTNQMDFRIEKVIKKADDSYINWEGYIIRLIAG